MKLDPGVALSCHSFFEFLRQPGFADARFPAQ